MTADLVRDNLQGHLRQPGGFGQAAKLCPHDIPAADRPVQGSLVHDGPKTKRWVAGEDGLAADPGLDKALDLFLSAGRHTALEGGPGVVLCLEQARDEQALVVE